VKPALQYPEGTISPVPLQYIPGEHATHCDTFVKPVTLEKAPWGHALGSKERAGQKKPAGHVIDVLVSF